MKKGWTMAELTVAMLVIIVLSYASISTMKNNSFNKEKIFVYAAIKNLMYANGSITDKYGQFYPKEASEASGDWYCLNVADALATIEQPNCSASDTVFKFANGVTISGIASAWQYPYKYKSSDAEACTSNTLCEEAPDFYYKNILIDVNGSKAPNKFGMDKFPMRVFRGYSPMGMDLSGVIYPACGTNDFVYDPSGTKKNLNKGNNYCATETVDFLMDNEAISYNIYRVDKTLVGTKDWSSGTMKDKNVTASLVAGQLPFMKADCLAYGGNGVFSKLQCNEAGFKIHDNCAHYDLCLDCSGAMHGAAYNVCPTSYNSIENCKARANALNPDADNASPDQACFITINKPMSGLGAFGGLIMGDIDM